MLRIDTLTYTCADSAALAAFWAEVLGYEVRGDLAVDPDETYPTLRFERGDKTPTIEVPLHLDINIPGEQAAEVDRLRGLGAHVVLRKTTGLGDHEETCTIMRDPEGNGFCIQGPDARAPGRPYVGNVTFSCAEPTRLGTFWRVALGYDQTTLPDGFLDNLLAAGLDPRELEAYDDAAHPEGRRPRLLFQRRQKTPAESPPLRLDLVADDVAEELERLEQLGATGGRGGALLDPEGNAFHIRAA